MSATVLSPALLKQQNDIASSIVVACDFRIKLALFCSFRNLDDNKIEGGFYLPRTITKMQALVV